MVWLFAGLWAAVLAFQVYVVWRAARNASPHDYYGD